MAAVIELQTTGPGVEGSIEAAQPQAKESSGQQKTKRPRINASQMRQAEDRWFEEAFYRAKKQDEILKEEAWSRVKQEMRNLIGFDSYEAYLDAAYGWELRSIYRSYMEEEKESRQILLQERSYVDIIDVMMDDVSGPKAHLRRSHLSASKTYYVLREAVPHSIKARIILWSGQGSLRTVDRFTELFGLGFRIHPFFFYPSHLNDGGLRETWPYPQSYTSLKNIGARIHVSRCSGLVPVLLVNGDVGRNLRLECEKAREHGHMEAVFILGDALPLLDVFEEVMVDELIPTAMTYFLWKSRHMIVNDEDVAIVSLLCLLDFNMIALREAYHESRKSWDRRIEKLRSVERYRSSRARDTPIENSSDPPHDLHHCCTTLRNHIEASEANKNAVMDTFLDFATFVPEHPIYNMFVNRMFRVIYAAKSLENEIRDYLQVDSNKMMLLESRESIRLSDHQIQESKPGEA